MEGVPNGCMSHQGSRHVSSTPALLQCVQRHTYLQIKSNWVWVSLLLRHWGWVQLRRPLPMATHVSTQAPPSLPMLAHAPLSVTSSLSFSCTRVPYPLVHLRIICLSINVHFLCPHFRSVYWPSNGWANEDSRPKQRGVGTFLSITRPMRRSTLISCDAQGLGQGRAFKSIHMNNRKTGYVEDFFAHFLFQHQGRPKLKEKKILDSSSMFIKRPTLISLDTRVLNKQRDKAMCAWLHALSKKRRHTSLYLKQCDDICFLLEFKTQHLTEKEAHFLVFQAVMICAARWLRPSQ